MQSVCAPVCSAVLWCVFDTTHIYWVQHWYCCNAAPSFSGHTYDIPLRDALWVIFWVRGTLCCTLKGCMPSMPSIGRLPPYWDITKCPTGRSTALTPVGRSFEIGRSKSRCTIPPYIAPPTVNRHYIVSFFLLFFHTSTFQLLDKPWSQVSSLLPPGSCLPFLSRIGFNDPTARRFLLECC